MVLIIAPLGRGAEVMASALAGAGIAAEICRDVAEVAIRVSDDAGVILLTEEVLTPSAIGRLGEAIETQAPWSDVPIIVLMAMGRMAEPSAAVVTNFQRLGNVTLLERPMRVMTLLSTVEAGLRARRRQYELRDHLAERQRRSEEAAAESRAKDEFLAMLGHELRNPLGAISAAAHVLDMTAPEGDSMAMARRVIVRQLRHITRLVDDLLDVSRVTSGKIEITRRPVDAAAAVTNCIAALRAGGAVDGHTIDVTAVTVWVDADEVRLDQIVNNLVGNAIKYTPEGGRIDVSVGPLGDDAVIRIRDTGIGITPDLLPRVFDLFVQGGGAVERKQGGLGIGLTLVRRLVELHGGSVRTSSAGAGQGSTFTVRLPAVAPPRPDAAPDSRPVEATERRRVLLVEDNDDARQMIAFMLQEAGHEVYEAVDGPAGVETALREHPDIAIVDVGLPGFNGYEVAQRIRAVPETGGVVLVALTGYGLPEDKRRAGEAGFDRHLMKPVDFDQLMHVISRGF